jgi:integrase
MEATKPVGIPPSVIGEAYRDDPDLAEAMFKNARATTQHVALQTAKTLMPTFSKWAERYKADKDSADVQQKRERSCAMFLKVCRDFPLNENDKVHMLDMARYMDDDEDGKQWAHKTIKNYVSYAKQAFDYARETRNDLGKIILSAHPFHNLRLGEFGAPVKPYISFNSDELHSIFNQELPHLDKLLLAILVTTGMRLDEASLMTWERVIKHEGTLCFALIEQINGDNQEQVLVKNTGSKRFIPVPEVIKPLLGNFGVGRLFNHRIDKEGKSEAAASDALMPYIRKICAHPQKALHSFRHTFIDLAREDGTTDVETRKFITGHSLGDVGGDYGSGPSMEKRLAVLNGINHPWLT